MPPEVSSYQPMFTPFTREPPTSIAIRSFSNINTRGTKKMTIFNKRKLIPLLVFILSGVSVLRLLKISVVTSFYYSHPCSSSACKKVMSLMQGQSKNQSIFSSLSEKEYQFLSKLISLKAPCNLLVFGLESEYLDLFSSVNGGGTTVILEEDPEKLGTVRRNHKNTRIYKVEYKTRAKEAYKLLKLARQDPACTLNSESIRKSSCILALTKLPNIVYERKWDVVVVDGPRGDSPDAPGRMSVIYTASVIARAGNTTDVVVHDMDRTIEKWFSWEFLCEENFVYSKGKLWNFKIAGGSNSARFCSTKATAIL